MKAQPTAIRFFSVLAALNCLLWVNLQAQTTNCVAPPAGLVGWWKAETNALDSAGANNGTVLPGVGYTSGQVGQAFAFNGDNNSFIEVPDAPALELTNEVTIEFWVKRLRLSFPSYPYADYIVEKGGDVTGGVQNYAVALHNPNYNYCLHFCFAGGWRGAGSVADTNVWHHCAVVARNGDTDPTFYIDGVAQSVVYSEGASTINLYPSTRPLHIGALLDGATGWYYFADVLVDELAIYSRALSAQEVQAIYSAGSAGKCLEPQPPVITSQPADQTVAAGAAATFSVGVSGAGPLSYQWCFNESLLAGQTQSALVLGNVQPAQAGGYYVVVTNRYGAATSDVASLTVLTYPPTITAQPQSTNTYVGSAVSLRVGASGTAPLSYQWWKNNAPLSEATSSAYSLLNPQLTDAGTYAVVVTNLYGAVTSAPAVLTVRVPPPCDPPPAGLVSWWRAENSLMDAWGNNDGYAGYPSYAIAYTAGRVGQAFSFSSDASGYVKVPDALALRLTSAFTLEAWVLPGSSQTVSLRTLVAKWNSLAQYGPNLTTNCSFLFGTTNNGALCLLVSPSNSGRTNVMLVAPTRLPAAQWSHVAATYDGAALKLYANGSLVAQRDYAGGVFVGTADVGIGAVAYTSNILYDQGSWPWLGAVDEVAIYNRALADDEILALYSADVSGKCQVAPTILAQPQSQAVPLGEDVLLAPTLQGTKPMTCQWRFNGQSLPGATQASLVLEKVQSNRAGSYSLWVSNTKGSALSSNALLTLLPAPVCVSPLPGLVSWWPADGSTADAAGNNPAVLYPVLTSTGYATGKVGRAFCLTNASASYKNALYAPNSPSLNFGSNADFSIETWVKYVPIPAVSSVITPYSIGPGPIQTIVSKQEITLPYYYPLPRRGAPVGYSLALNLGRLSCSLCTVAGGVTNAATFIADGPDLRDGMFHHVAMTVDRNALNGGNLYVDGQVVRSFDPTPFIGSLSNSAALSIGTDQENPFTGLIDELSLYNRALSATEVLAIRQAGAAGKFKTPPFIVTQPANQFVNFGANATFSVEAGGSGLLHYQWRFGSVPLAWGTSATLTITNVSQQSGPYAVYVTNAFGAVLSASAILTINYPPVARARNVTVAAGPDCLANASVDNYSYDFEKDTFTLTQTPPGPYPLGTNLVTLTAVDSHGLSNSATALVVVVDQTPPMVVCPAPVVQGNDLNQCGAVVTYPLPTTSDLCSAVTNLTCTPPPGAFFPIGETVVQCAATDAAGNVGSNTFTVTIKDTQPPTLTCPADITVTNAHDAWSSVVSFAPTATDNCPGVGVPVCDPASGSAFSLGVHTVKCSVTDAAGNTNQGSFTVTVLPGNQLPVPVIEVAPLAKFPGNTNLLVLAPVLASNAVVYFDASKSYDPDDASCNYSWYEGTNCFATSVVATNPLCLGRHDIRLWLDDTFPLGTNCATVTVEVLAPSQAVDIVRRLVGDSTLPPNGRQPLEASLNAAAAAFKQGNLNAALNELQAFQNKVRAQIAPVDPVLAAALLQAADQMLNALSPDSVADTRDLKPHSLVRQSDGKVRMKFTGKAPRVPLVQASSNLKDWTTIGIAADNGDGTFGFEDLQAARLPNRFYRILCP